MPNDVIQGAVTVVNLPDIACFENFSDFIQALANSLAIEIPDTITNVVIGNSEPTNPQTTALWIRRDNSGTFIGFYVYSSGSWVQVYPVPGEFTRIHGSSNNVPEGFQRADLNPDLTAGEITYLHSQWYENPSNPGEYLIYDVYWETA